MSGGGWQAGWSETGGAPRVPFEGLRRHALALLGGSILVVLIALLPDLTPKQTDPPPFDLLHGRIVDVLPASEDPSAPDVTVELIGGPDAGKRIDAFLQGPAGQIAIPDYHVGDEVVVQVSRGGDQAFIAVSDRYRIPALGLLAGLFALGVAVVGGWRGVRSVIALVLSLAVVLKIVVPLLLAGWPPVPVAVGAATCVTIVTFLLTEGARRSTLAAVLGTFIALALTAVLAATFNGVAQFTPFQAEGDLAFLDKRFGGTLDFGGLLLAAVIFGALGVLDDVTVTQAATVHELREADPDADRWRLFARAMNVGRSHIAATVNTLVLAYVGASLPLLVLFAAGRQDPLLTASGEAVAVEIAKALVGSIGIVAAVPLTTAIGVVLTGRVPLLGEEGRIRRAPGWD